MTNLNYSEAVEYAVNHPEASATDVSRMFSVSRPGLIAAAGRRGRLFPKSRPGRPRTPVAVGQRFGRLVVVADTGSMVELLCECGRRRWMYPSALASGASYRSTCGVGCSLGPLPRYRVPKKPKTVLDRSPEQQAHAFLLAIIGGANSRKIAVTITIDDIIRVRVGKPCEYCGSALGKSTCIDRIDNSLGYHPDNIAACCAHCNDAKGHLLTGDEFKAAMAVRLARTGAGKAWEGVTMRPKHSARRRK